MCCRCLNFDKGPNRPVEMLQITRDRCRQVLLDGIDKILNHRFLSWLSNEQNAVLSGCRATVVSNDALVDAVAANVGPYQSRSTNNDVKLALLGFIDAANSTAGAARDDPMYVVERLIQTDCSPHKLSLRFGSGYVAPAVLVYLDDERLGELDAAQAVDAFVEGKKPTIKENP